ncbi:MAG: hypothetical protein P1Q69_00315 [Candidatus Thorarchaeota archaeon]|nr:hypothetical protein [Candidatus Thorarchaeota archaeon]
MDFTSNSGSEGPPHAGTYRVKFSRENFLRILEIANPQTIYHVIRMYFFAYDGFTMYTMECHADDFVHFLVIEAMEFSNRAWNEGMTW